MPEGFDGPRLGDRYVLGPLLGRGAVGEVRAGWDDHLRRPVAVKRLTPGVSLDAASGGRFRAEGIAAARLTSPRVVALLDIGEHEGSPFLVMERLSGLTWADELRACRPGDERVLAVVDDILAGLQAVHAAGIVHRDVKPSNVLLMEDGAAKLADFGIAHITDLASMTLPGMVVGSFAYMAPERLAGAAPTPASDIWSVGVLLYESLTGQRPFTGESALAVAATIQRGSYQALRTARPELPAAIRSAVESALHPDPAVRPPVAHLRAALALHVPTGRAPVRARPAVAPPAWGGAARQTLEQSASAVLTQWLQPQHGTEQARLAVRRGGRLRAWAIPGMILAGVTATVIVATLVPGGDPPASAGAEGAGVAAPQVAATSDAVRERTADSGQTRQTVRVASTTAPAGRGDTKRSAVSTQSGPVKAARRQAALVDAADGPGTKVKKHKANGKQRGKRKGKD